MYTENGIKFEIISIDDNTRYLEYRGTYQSSFNSFVYRLKPLLIESLNTLKEDNQFNWITPMIHFNQHSSRMQPIRIRFANIDLIMNYLNMQTQGLSNGYFGLLCQVHLEVDNDDHHIDSDSSNDSGFDSD